MSKALSLLLIIGATALFLNRGKISAWKQQVIEAVNPAAKERRLINNLTDDLNRLDDLLSNRSAGQLSGEKWQKAASVFSDAQETLKELEETNRKIDLGANLSNLLQKIIPLSQPPSPTWLPPENCQN